MCNYPSEGFRHMTRAEWERKKMSDVPQAIRHKANEKHGAHRTRATSGGAWTTVAVYLTDVKRVDPPAPSAPEPVPQIENPAARAQHASSPAGNRSGCRGLRGPQGHAQSWRADRRGAAVVPDAARSAKRMVELAEIQPGMCVLEPARVRGTWQGRSAAPSQALTSISSRSIRSCAPFSRRPASRFRAVISWRPACRCVPTARVATIAC